MRKNIFLLTLATSFALLMSKSCKLKAPEPELPPLTHEGKNVLGCKINGKVWVLDKGKATWNHPYGVGFGLFNDSTLHIFANDEYEISLNHKYNRITGLYEPTSKYPYQNRVVYYTNPPFKGSQEHYTDSAHTGWINVSFYTGTIVAGTFAFDAVNDSGNVVHITEGRFDIGQ